MFADRDPSTLLDNPHMYNAPICVFMCVFYIYLSIYLYTGGAEAACEAGDEDQLPHDEAAAHVHPQPAAQGEGAH